MTGALIPKNFDTIIPIEKIIFKKNRKFILINEKIKEINILGMLDLIIKKKT